MKYVNFSRNKQNSFMKLIKKRTKYSWKKLAQILQVNRSMIFFYHNAHSKLPYTYYLKLCRLAKIPSNKEIQLVEIKNKAVKIKIPELNTQLAEFLGALAGDGHMNRGTYEISVSMDKDLDKKYSDHITKMYKLLFAINARKYVQDKHHKVKCFAYSKELVNYLANEYTIPVGKKKGNLKIPEQIKKNKKLLRAYIRGLFDTDGSFHRHHKQTAMLGIISRDSKHVTEIKEALINLGFIPSINNKNIYIYKKEEIDRFFKEIKPANMKHIYKYEYYKKYKRVPLTKELVKR